MLFGEQIKNIREEKGLLQRHLAALLEVDTPMFSKIERGERKARRDQVIKIAKILNTDESELLKVWLADKVYDVVKEEDFGLEAIQYAGKEFKKRHV